MSATNGAAPRIAVLEPREAGADYVLSFALGLGETGARYVLVGTPQYVRKAAGLNPPRDVPIYPYFRLAFKGGARNLLPYVTGWLRTIALLARWRPDVVHVQWLIKPRVEAALLPLLARALRARLVYTAHNVLPHEPRPGDREAFGALYERCDAVIVHTEKSRRELLSAFSEVPADRVVVIPHGNHEYRLTEALSPEAAKAELGIDPDRLLVAFAGKIRPYKGLASLLDAWERSAASRSADLLIAGHPDDPDHHEELEAHVRARGLTGVHFLPKYLSDHEMQLVLGAADAMVLPYLAIDQSGILLFAMTAGRPIVASRLESFVEVFEDEAGALFHEPGDAQGLASALDRVVGDHELRARMGRTSREIAVRNHSWPDIARATTALYS